MYPIKYISQPLIFDWLIVSFHLVIDPYNTLYVLPGRLCLYYMLLLVMFNADIISRYIGITIITNQIIPWKIKYYTYISRVYYGTRYEYVGYYMYQMSRIFTQLKCIELWKFHSECRWGVVWSSLWLVFKFYYLYFKFMC